jgi:tetratricopeptide (TPR) repeat protein
MPEPTGSLATALAHATRLLASNPSTAAVQANEILKVMPGQPQALLLLAKALQKQGDSNGAIAAFEALTKSQPGLADAQYELGVALAASGRLDPAIAALKRTLRLDANHADAWRALGDALTLAGDSDGAADAYARQIKASVRDPQLLEAAIALCDGKLAIAERGLRDFLKRNPTDPAAIRMLAETGARLGRLEDAENLLARCLELAPSFHAARHNYALVLHRQAKSEDALREVDLLLKEDSRNPNYRALKPAILVRLGDHEQAIECYESFLAEHSRQPKSWMSYGHALKTVGRQDDSIAAYRKSIALLASLGETWWSLANLKTVRFSGADIAEMKTQLEKPNLDDEDLFHLHFALGKALEDEGAYEESFSHYEKGNALRRSLIHYDADDTGNHADRSISFFTTEFFGARKAVGCVSPDPIFVVGLPRAGSTLIEQILSSHSAVEGTMELPDIIAIARRLSGKKKKQDSEYPDVFSRLDPAEFRALGEEYLARVRVQRRDNKPYFVDKMPNNFQHVGLIHLILPNAKIIDARRHPLGCCFSNFKQHFARGQNFTYDLADIGRYYRDYVRLLAHFDAVLPGRVHRVFYENMVDDTEREIRALLAYCGLPFEENCLRFYETERAVRTASSEQVRMPIFTEGVDQWRHFEPWLGPLKAALGNVLDSYPSVPQFEATKT